jgi:hypothetical protein
MKKLYVVPSNTKDSAQKHDKSESMPMLPTQVSVPAKVYAKVFQQTRILSLGSGANDSDAHAERLSFAKS